MRRINESLFNFFTNFYNLHKSLIITDKGCVLSDIDPSKGVFSDTPKTPKGRQLRDLNTAMRSQYNILITRLSASGSHSANDDLILHAYNRCGVEGRGKDVGLFYYYLTVKEMDLEFLTAVLFEDESASQAVTNTPSSGPSETSYAKRQRTIKEAAERQQTALTERNMSAIRSFMSPSSGDNDAKSLLNESIIKKNNATAFESNNSAQYFESMISTEESKKKALEIDNLMKVMGNSAVYALFTQEDQDKMSMKLKSLMGLSL